MASSPNSKLLSSMFMPELQRQLADDQSLWPNIKGLFVITVNKRKKPQAKWCLLFQGNQVEPIITMDAEMAKEKAKAARARTVRITIDDSDLVNFVTGGLTGVRAYMSGKIKVRGDLMLAQKLEEVFNKTGGQERALEFLKQNEKEVAAITKAKL
ncbi:hypothetical protein K450DRAFT_299148 [Umbelopsis ramanniana AG]|uniref:SCP2 domain-containing protein n=1 Tax=Umbelopsis ramanniana AG TaxID=1314678 RepID=A0AAD5HFP3_UMBRA|nr:uncharacterized protein K450DRAFT_299148 [Umbelopsis ramanniana AG]KAI8580906.1 hypothetical protein K450DRAFT_299148 [Umbelopsis ramanniana AG]